MQEADREERPSVRKRSEKDPARPIPTNRTGRPWTAYLRWVGGKCRTVQDSSRASAEKFRRLCRKQGTCKA